LTVCHICRHGIFFSQTFILIWFAIAVDYVSIDRMTIKINWLILNLTWIFYFCYHSKTFYGSCLGSNRERNVLLELLWIQYSKHCPSSCFNYHNIVPVVATFIVFNWLYSVNICYNLRYSLLDFSLKKFQFVNSFDFRLTVSVII